MNLTQEQPDDWWDVEALYDLCFAPGRSALSSYRLREGVDPVQEICMIARNTDGILAGAIRYWPIRVGRAPALLLGPIAVHPTFQGEGIGGLLIEQSLQKAHGWARVLLVGDEPYYRRYGFSRLSGIEMPPPTNPDRILGRSLAAPGWDGVAGKVTQALPD